MTFQFYYLGAPTFKFVTANFFALYPAHPSYMNELAEKSAKYCRELPTDSKACILYRDRDRVEFAAAAHITVPSTCAMPDFTWIHRDQQPADQEKALELMSTGEARFVITCNSDLEAVPDESLNVVIVTHDTKRCIDHNYWFLPKETIIRKLKKGGRVVDMVASSCA